MYNNALSIYYSEHSHSALLPQARVPITALITLFLCSNPYSCYCLGQILYYYQLITYFNPHIIKAATVLPLVLLTVLITAQIVLRILM